jgi:putative membrane protein
MTLILLRWALSAMALMVVPEIVPGVSVTGFGGALLCAAVLGLVNSLIRPLIVLITLPITLLTLGLFTLVINGLMFWLVANIMDGLSVSGFSPAFFGALVYGLLTWIINIALREASRPGPGS